MLRFDDKIKQSQVTNRTFNYSRGNVSLNFTLNIDVKANWLDFLALLKAAQQDVEKELENS